VFKKYVVTRDVKMFQFPARMLQTLAMAHHHTDRQLTRILQLVSVIMLPQQTVTTR